MTPEHEREIAGLARSGDEEAFRLIVVEYQERVFALGFRLMADEADAMDLTQEVFVEAWKGLSRYRGDSRLLTWLQGIAVRVARRRWRSLGRRLRREGAYAHDRFEASVRRTMPEASIDLERGIAALPPRMRAALVLHCIEGFPQREVARLMGISEGTVKAHIHGARKALEEKLDR